MFFSRWKNTYCPFHHTLLIHIYILWKDNFPWQEGMKPVRGASSVVSLSSQHGLTVSIKNNIALHQTQHSGMYSTFSITIMKLAFWLSVMPSGGNPWIINCGYEGYSYLKLSTVVSLRVLSYHPLFLLFINDLLNLNQYPIHFYADDTKLQFFNVVTSTTPNPTRIKWREILYYGWLWG